ncbi:ImmA/IrrE family metallo-endopeptidase [Legionella pneumophila serogroup 1]|nr:ImmA/IrrE family metallo-endopeptidase [Legionella pneumophila]
MINIKLKQAASIAEKIVKDEKLEFPIDLTLLAKRNGILLEPKPSSATGVSGMLIRCGEEFTIIYATHINNEGYQRFSIAHEFGHYFLPSHPDHVFKNGNNIHESHAGFCSNNQIELEADHFAAGLLMPKHLFTQALGRFSDGLSAIKNLAKICNTSLIASAIRYTQLTDAAIAIIISSGTLVEYSFVSKQMQQIKGYSHLKKGDVLPKRSLTYNFNRNLNNIERAMQDSSETDLLYWFHTDDEIIANEEIIGLGGFCKTLTVITAQCYDYSDDIDDDWEEPRF